MSPDQQELFDVAILRVLDANGRNRYGLTVAAVCHFMVQFGFPNPDPDLVLERLDYLVGKRLVEEVTKLLGKANRAWRVTTAGITYVDEH